MTNNALTIMLLYAARKVVAELYVEDHANFSLRIKPQYELVSSHEMEKLIRRCI